MNQTKAYTKKDLSLRIGLMLLSGIVIWHLTVYFSDTFLGKEYSSLKHFLSAIITTLLTLALLQGALKVDKLSWKQLGQSTIKTNIISFFLGLVLWSIPASIGVFICLTFGWVNIEVSPDINHLLLSALVLFVSVFFIEALPEELIFRGYIYRWLNALFPHWGTIILQALAFTLFAYAIGAIYSPEQLQFIPGFAIILGVFRAMSGNVWTAIGFHAAIMTATQILGPNHGYFDVSGIFFLRFFAFILLPSVIGAAVLSFIYSHHNWSGKEPFY